MAKAEKKKKQKKAKKEPLAPRPISQCGSTPSSAASPAEDNKHGIVFRKEAPGPGHQSCSLIRRPLAVSRSPSSMFRPFCSLPKPPTRAFHSGTPSQEAFAGTKSRARTQARREASSTHTREDVSRSSQLQLPKLAEIPPISGVLAAVPSLSFSNAPSNEFLELLVGSRWVFFPKKQSWK